MKRAPGQRARGPSFIVGAVDTQAVEAVDSLNANYGAHKARAVHAKGTLCKGRFTPTSEAAALTRAAHMQQPVDVTARFSNASGDPATRDAMPDGRGLAVKFYLSDGSRTDVVAVTLPAFLARTPEDFLQLNRALKRDERRHLPKPRPARLLAYLVTHWSARHALFHGLRAKPVPSYANCRYEALHAFKWVDGEGAERYVRYRLIPHAGERTLARGEAKGRDRDFLQQEIAGRLEREPVRFTLEVQLAEPGDPVDDSTAIWPKSRRTVDAGVLELTAIDDSRERGDDVLVFDPMRLTDGIEASADPILPFRSRAYSVSVERRT